MIRKNLLKEGISKEKIDAFEETMARIKGVLDGTVNQPGGINCQFPHCRCNEPWTKCEKDK